MSITAERLMVEVQADVRDALRRMDQVEKRTTTMTSRVGRLARTMGVAFGGAAIVSGMTKTIGLAMNFDQTVRQIGVQTDLSGRKLDRMSELALKMGKDTIYSAQQAGQSMLELAKGGLSAATIRGGALEQTLRLAAAGGLELDSAAGYIVQGLNTYNLKAKQAVQVTTALAGGANASSVSVEDLGLALSQVGAGSVNAGMSIQETVAALAAFGNAGIRGSDAGTTLKTMLASLVPNTTKAKDAMKEYGLEFVKRNGDFKSMAQVAQELKEGLGDLSQAERSAAMRTIFGSDATRAATVLMREGEKGIRKYVKATKDQKKTQEMANAAMEGAKGAWENFKGSIETAAIRMGTKLLPAFTKAANAGGDFVDDAMSWGPAIQESFGWTIDVAKATVKAFKPLVEVAEAAADAWDGLPSPVKSTVVQLGLAALIFPRLAAAASSAGATVSAGLSTMSAKAKQFGADMTYAETRTARLGQVARVAAGAGGILALQASAGETSDEMKLLGRTAGGALLGFSVGGPWGAAIGGTVGALSALAETGQTVSQSMRDIYRGAENARGAQLDLRAALDQTTGAMTRQARQTVAQDLYDQGLIQSAKNLGLSTSTLVSAVLGQEEAYKRVSRAVKEYRNVGGAAATGVEQALSDSAVNIGAYLEGANRKFRKTREEIQEVTRASRVWDKALKGVPQKVRTKLEAVNYERTFDQMGKLVDTYKMTPKQIKTTVKALGMDLTKKELAYLIQEGKKLGDMKVDPTVGLNRKTFDQRMAEAREQMRRLGGSRAFPEADLNDKASPKLNGITDRMNKLDGRKVTATVTINQAIRRTGRLLGGVSLPQFDSGGFTGGRSPRDVTGVVHGREYVMDAETTKRALPLLEAIHSAKGRVWGYAAGGRAGSRPGAPSLQRGELVDYIRNLTRTIVQANGHLDKTFNKLDRLIRRNMSGAKESAWLKRSRLTQEKLARIGERQVAVQKRLADAQEKVANIRQAKGSFVDTVRQGMAGQATVLNAGNTAAAIRQSLSVQVAKVKKFAGMLKKLRKMGYSNAIVKQVAMAGVEGGYNAALALIGADSGTVNDINKDFATIRRMGGDTARQLGAQMFDASIRAAEGLVKGLKQRRREVRELLMDTAMAMQDALRKALGIKPGGGNGQGGQANKVAARTSAYAGTPTLAALQGGQRAGSSVTFHFTTVNPLPEPQSQTTNKALAKVAALSLV